MWALNVLNWGYDSGFLHAFQGNLKQGACQCVIWNLINFTDKHPLPCIYYGICNHLMVTNLLCIAIGKTAPAIVSIR